MTTAPALTPIQLLERELESDTLELLEALAKEGYALESHRGGKFLFRLPDDAVSTLMASPEEVAEGTASLHAKVFGRKQSPTGEVFYALDVYADRTHNITFLGADPSPGVIDDADRMAVIGINVAGERRVVTLQNIGTAEEVLAQYGNDSQLIPPHAFEPVADLPGECGRCSAEFEGEIHTPVTEAAAASDEPRAEHEANLKGRLISILEAREVTCAAAPGGVTCERGVFVAKCGADGHTIYDALDEATRLRLRSGFDAAQPYLLLCCVPAKEVKAVELAAVHSNVKAGVWEEEDAFPFDIADLLPTLAETLIAQAAEIETLSDFQAFIREHDLQAVFEGGLDPERRFPLVRALAIQEALKACALRLGMTVASEAEDETESPFLETIGGSGETKSPEVEIIGRAVADNIGPLALGQIRTDGGTQPRAGLDRDTVEEYAETIMSNQFPPVVVFYEAGEGYWLADGFHRVAAAKKAGKAELIAEVRKGTRRDAVLYSVSANASHGLRRSNADKRRAVETLLQDEEWSQWSNREIASRCGVRHGFVGNVREELSGSRVQMNAKATRGGTEYTVSTANIGKSNSPAEALPDGKDDSHTSPEATIAPATTEAATAESTASAGEHQQATGRDDVSFELTADEMRARLRQARNLGDLRGYYQAVVVAEVESSTILTEAERRDLAEIFASCERALLGGATPPAAPPVATNAPAVPAGPVHAQAEELSADSSSSPSSPALTEFERATVLLTVQFLPVQPGETERRVKLGVRNDADTPLFSSSAERHWVGAAAQLLNQLKRELPARVAARATKKVATTSTTAARTRAKAKPAAKSKPAAKTGTKQATTKPAAKTASKKRAASGKSKARAGK
jgi:hypothetical protein